MLLSSRQAAVLLETHESSVKRWCNADELACEYTDGGHRRIRVETLVAFAREREMACDLRLVGSDASTVVEGVMALRRSRVPDALIETLMGWMLEADTTRVVAMISIARSFDVTLAAIYDILITEMMRRIGSSWAAGAFEIGDEHRISECLLDVLYHIQATVGAGREQGPQIAVLGAGPGEEHVVGAMMIRTLLTEAGWQVIYLGRNVPDEDFALFQRRSGAELICLSVTNRQTPQSIVKSIRAILSMVNGEKPFRLAVGGSGAPEAEAVLKPLVDPELVQFFSSATDFTAWAQQLLQNTRVATYEMD